MNLSNALALAQIMIKHFDLAARTKDGLVALLTGPANDWLGQVCISSNFDKRKMHIFR